jgi:DNA-binding NarL/FixJ family response regulator
MHSRPTLVRQALRNGARGYLLKRSVTEELLLAVRSASRGESYLSPEISGIIVDDFLTHPVGADQSSPFDQLTPREREVLQLIAEGHTNQAMAQLLNVSIKTVERHRANLIQNRGEAPGQPDGQAGRSRRGRADPHRARTWPDLYR